MTQQQIVVLSDAQKGLVVFADLDVSILGAVENVSGEFLGQGGGQRLAEQHDVPFLGQVSLDPRVRVSGDGGVRTAVAALESPPGPAFRETSSRVAARVSVRAFDSSEWEPEPGARPPLWPGAWAGPAKRCNDRGATVCFSDSGAAELEQEIEQNIWRR